MLEWGLDAKEIREFVHDIIHNVGLGLADPKSLEVSAKSLFSVATTRTLVSYHSLRPSSFLSVLIYVQSVMKEFITEAARKKTGGGGQKSEAKKVRGKFLRRADVMYSLQAGWDRIALLQTEK